MILICALLVFSSLGTILNEKELAGRILRPEFDENISVFHQNSHTTPQVSTATTASFIEQADEVKSRDYLEYSMTNNKTNKKFLSRLIWQISCPSRLTTREMKPSRSNSIRKQQRVRMFRPQRKRSICYLINYFKEGLPIIC
jgi:hypothetical protein